MDMDIQMNTELSNMFGLLFGDYVSDHKIQSNVAAIKYYNGMTIDNVEMDKKIAGLGDKIIFKSHVYRQDIMQEAYEPFLKWIREGEGPLSYEDVRDYMVVISRMTGYDEEDVREYLENSFEMLIWDWGYFALIVGR